MVHTICVRLAALVVVGKGGGLKWWVGRWVVAEEVVVVVRGVEN